MRKASASMSNRAPSGVTESGTAGHVAVDGVESQGQGGQPEEEGPVVDAHERGGHQRGHRLAEA